MTLDSYQQQLYWALEETRDVIDQALKRWDIQQVYPREMTIQLRGELHTLIGWLGAAPDTE